MGIKKFLIIAMPPFLILVNAAYAHCPLCTAGAAVAAGGAVWLGVSKAAIGVFIGAFAVSIGWWVSRLIKKQYIPLQRQLIILISFVTTIVPLLPLLADKHPIYISLIGGYGSLLNRTYIFDFFLLGSVIGAFIVSITPFISNKITSIRGKTLPYQGISLTFILLILAGIIVQIAV